VIKNAIEKSRRDILNGLFNKEEYSIPAAHKAVYALLVKFKNRPLGRFSNLPSTGLPSGKIPDGIFLQAGLAVFAFACPAKLIHRSAFQSLPRIKQFMRYWLNLKTAH